MWNEPNLREYSAKNKPDPREYARLLKISQRIILDVDPQAQIILAGMPEIPGRGIYVHTYLKRLYKVRGIERTSTPSRSTLRAQLARPRGGSDPPTAHAATGPRRPQDGVGHGVRLVRPGPNDAFQVKGPKGQATQLTKSVKLMRRKRGRYNLGTINWFRWRATATGSRTGSGSSTPASTARTASRSAPVERRGVHEGQLPAGRRGTTAGAARADDLLEPRSAAAQPLLRRRSSAPAGTRSGGPSARPHLDGSVSILTSSAGSGDVAGPRMTAPSERRNTLPCSGQVKQPPSSSPSASDPPRWVQRFASAYIRPS